MFTFIINKLNQYYLCQELKKQNIKHQSITLEKVKSMLILFDAGNDEDTALIKKQIQLWQNKGIKVDVLGFISKVKKNTTLPLNYISSKHINWMQIPSINIIDEYANKQHDVLLNFFTNSLLPLEYIAALSKSTLRIGKYNSSKTYCADFMIHLKNGNDLQELIAQTEHYLNQLNKKDIQHA